jgi:hypothetical protein
MKWCPPQPDGRAGCIVTAFEAQWAILRDRTQPAAARAQALRFVIHFTGDDAQPLHVSDNHDQGGNCTSIRFFADERARNLHGIWDTQLIARALAAGPFTQPQYARQLDERFSARWKEWGESRANFLAWTWDSHRIAETVTYGDLKPEIPVAPAAAGEVDKDACDVERAHVADLHISVGDPYEAQAMPVIQQQLAKAGYRLAGLLNSIFQ